MKVAVICYDHLLKKTKSLLEGEGHDVTFFICKPEQKINFENFSSIPVFTDRLIIPARTDLQTKKQGSLFKKIEASYREMQSRLTDSKKSFYGSESLAIIPGSFDRKFDSVMDIYFDIKSKQVLFEIQNKGVEPYDLLICESHPLISHELNKKAIQIKQPAGTAKYIWSSFGFTYELLKSLAVRIENKSFFLVADSARDSIIDNWFLCQLAENQIKIWSYFPDSQMNNPEYQDFYIERLRLIAGDRLPFLQLKSFEGSERTTVYFESWALPDGKMSLKNQIVFVPNMGFWSQEQIQKHIIEPLSKNLKKLKPLPGATV